ncbi:MAG: ATP-binding protein [Nitrosotalea sp.]
MVTEVIEEKGLLDVLHNAIEFEKTKGKQKSCFYCGEKFQIQKNSDLTENEEIPDQWTCSNGHAIASIGWEWHDVSNSYFHVQRLLRLGLVTIKYKSNKHTEYHLVNREYVKKILQHSLELRTAKELPGELVIPNDLFASIVGYHEVKELLNRVISSPNPVHVLLVGPPASAKTLFQMEMEKLSGAFFLDGANITRAGLTDFLFSYDIRYLIIDEMEEMNQKDLAALFSFMQTGQLSETKYGRTRTKEMKTWIIGSCNNVSGFSKKLLSRFLRVRFKEYTYEQFLEITKFILQKQAISLDLSKKIVNFVWHDIKSRDVRDVIKISTLVKNEKDLDWIKGISQKVFL